MINEKEVEAMKTEKKNQITWLKEFIERWDRNGSAIADAHRLNLSKEDHDVLGTQQNNMIDEYSAYCKEQNLAEMSADELVCELEAQLGCIEDGKF
jgi:esterase/lipase